MVRDEIKKDIGGEKNMKNLEKKILEQFKKEMKMEDRNDLIISVDYDYYGNFLNECEIMESHDYGKVWQVTTDSTGRIKGIYDMTIPPKQM